MNCLKTYLGCKKKNLKLLKSSENTVKKELDIGKYIQR